VGISIVSRQEAEHDENKEETFKNLSMVRVADDGKLVTVGARILDEVSTGPIPVGFGVPKRTRAWRNWQLKRNGRWSHTALV